VLRKGQTVASSLVRNADGERVRLVAARPVTRILRTDERAGVAVHAPREIEGPVAARTPVGTVLVRVRGRVVDRVDLLTATRVRHVGIVERAVDAILRPGTLALLALVVLVVALSAARRRRRDRAPDRKAGTE
jgi:hypothetical protein